MTEPRPRPSFGPAEAADVLARVYGLRAESVEELPSERDRNFRVRSGGADRVLKIANAAEPREILEFQNAVLAFLAAREPGLGLPRVLYATDGAAIASARSSVGATHLVRLLTFLPGRFLAHVRPHTPELLRSLGDFLGRMDRALLEFPGAMPARELKWDMRNAPGTVRRYLPLVRDARMEDLVRRFVELYERETGPRLPRLRTSLLYNDANDHNILAGHAEDPGRAGTLFGRFARVAGAIDFGDMVPGWLAVEPAVAAAYAMLDKPDPLEAAAAVVAGYHRVLPLAEDEIAALYPFMTMRLCLSVAIGAQQQAAERDNDYLRISQRAVRDLLGALAGVHPRLAHAVLRDACGLPACPRAAAIAARLREEDERGGIGRVVAADLRAPGQAVLDLGVGSLDLEGLAFASDPRVIEDLADRRRRETGRAAAIGRYDEARAVYDAPAFRVPANDGDDARTVHLGVDLFQPPGSPVFAPLDGVVHSFRDNASPRDYGPTIVLEHRLGDAPPFFTLYGHLARTSLEGLAEGAAVRKGDRIGAIGETGENGGWPPHLHFQVVADMLDLRGDFPGVAAPGRRAVWRSLCPDPNLILGIPAGELAAPGRSRDEILRLRRDRLGPTLSVSYRRPLKIVRGFGRFLFDEDGRRYLDSVNNVAHVGHAHPRVVAAARRQMAVLNTNTRYLHDAIVEYAERLRRTLPAPLGVFFFVNSGSEANDLALRLAWTRARRRDVIVLEGAYHGNLSSLVDISPYKFDGPGGSGAPPHVHVAPIPDVYRGRFRSPDPGAARRYADEAGALARRLTAEGRAPAAFIAESVPSCAGQIVLPDGYLDAVYREVRAAGGICIADEVQVGFGRAGTHFWAFETQGVVPDVVTMGKPIGNGHPLGAVVTTPEVAAAFVTGMEYFNTYGGNPVSCATGLAVLDVLEDERLQENARRVGAEFRAGLDGLRAKHPLVGDVRGLGLFLGVELVRDRDTREPAGEEAGYAAERLRDRGILASTDGPFHNVIKIKPPLVFTREDAARYVETLDDILGEDPLRND